MRKISRSFGKNLHTACLILSLGAVPTVVGVLTTSCAGDRYHESTGEGIDDTAITGRVKRALSKDTDYKYDDVKVTTFKGTVQLSGFANSRDAKKRAGEIAKTVNGVQNLENNITVKD